MMFLTSEMIQLPQTKKSYPFMEKKMTPIIFLTV